MLGNIRPSVRSKSVSINTHFEPGHLSGSPAVISDTGHRHGKCGEMCLYSFCADFV